jgi:hypothetical protein
MTIANPHDHALADAESANVSALSAEDAALSAVDGGSASTIAVCLQVALVTRRCCIQSKQTGKKTTRP